MLVIIFFRVWFVSYYTHNIIHWLLLLSICNSASGVFFPSNFAWFSLVAVFCVFCLWGWWYWCSLCWCQKEWYNKSTSYCNCCVLNIGLRVRYCMFLNRTFESSLYCLCCASNGTPILFFFCSWFFSLLLFSKILIFIWD